ncbi:MAG: hypothetical protein OXE79_01970 [Acidimicrobiaceae bacterium]|nr:hypothetical protein [Acidimicrobiaceae bacterium]MCY4280578.1 hypothetical protein [Acidimicrobiaceae bacterium]MCY4293352.1 hypothetical protein [Acidimicrobiaceae bacterium]
MGSFSSETIDFTTGDTDAVLRQMEALAQRGDGSGWINIGPGLREDQIEKLPRPSPLGGWFSGRGPVVPMATWTPPSTGRSPSPTLLGVQHGSGPKALNRLREAGAPLPDRWRKIQDHAKNGIVVQPSAEASHQEMLQWLLKVCWALCPIDVEDHWLAEVHLPD